MKNKYIRLKAMLIAGMMCLTSSTLTGCGSKDNKSEDLNAPESTVCFDVGEHIISVPIEENFKFDNFQHEYYEGYEPVGISLATHASFLGSTNVKGTIIYSNVEEVNCSSSLIDEDGNYLYLDFGTPLYYSYDENDFKSKGNIKEFDIGEHIISVPITEDNRNNNMQYDYHEGYEVVGMATTMSSDFPTVFDGVLLYKNIIPVKCLLKDNGYTEFGIPIELLKKKTYK